MKIYEGHISTSFAEPLRNTMIYKYQNKIQIKNKKNSWHNATKCTDTEVSIKIPKKDEAWNLNMYKNIFDTTNIIKENKIVQQEFNSQNINNNKLFLTSVIPNNFCNRSPLGLTWDSTDYSCAYDSLFTILHHMWNEGQFNHKKYFENGTHYLQLLHTNFHSLRSNQGTLEIIRDHLRIILNHNKPLQYHFGKNYTNLDELIRDFTTEASYGTSKLQCLNCNFTIQKPYSYLQDYTAVGWCSSDYEKLKHTASIQEYLNYKIIKNLERTNKKCPNCFRYNKKDFPLYTTQCLNKLPAILIFALAPWIDINNLLTFNVSGILKHYILKGIIYTNGNHFTARLIDKDFIIWYHDGQTTHSVCQREQYLMQIENSNQLKFCREQYKAIMAFYADDCR